MDLHKIIDIKFCCGKRMVHVPEDRYIESYSVGEGLIPREHIEPQYCYCTVCGNRKYYDEEEGK